MKNKKATHYWEHRGKGVFKNEWVHEYVCLNCGLWKCTPIDRQTKFTFYTNQDQPLKKVPKCNG